LLKLGELLLQGVDFSSILGVVGISLRTSIAFAGFPHRSGLILAGVFVFSINRNSADQSASARHSPSCSCIGLAPSA